MKAYLREAVVGAFCGLIIATLLFAGWFFSLLLTQPAVVLARF